MNKHTHTLVFTITVKMKKAEKKKVENRTQ